MRGIAGLALLVLACGDDAREQRDGGACIDDCSPYACDPTGGCFRSCATATECAPDHVCEGRACVGTECTAEEPGVCHPYACVNGDCAADCALGPCADGYYCRGNDSECVPHCASRGDPLCEGYVCALEVGECEPYCGDELPCAAGYACDADGECEPDGTAPPCTAGCAPYACVEDQGRCATHCVQPSDCAEGAACVSGTCEMEA